MYELFHSLLSTLTKGASEHALEVLATYLQYRLVSIDQHTINVECNVTGTLKLKTGVRGLENAL